MKIRRRLRVSGKPVLCVEKVRSAKAKKVGADESKPPCPSLSVLLCFSQQASMSTVQAAMHSKSVKIVPIQTADKKQPKGDDGGDKYPVQNFSPAVVVLQRPGREDTVEGKEKKSLMEEK